MKRLGGRSGLLKLLAVGLQFFGQNNEVFLVFGRTLNEQAAKQNGLRCRLAISLAFQRQLLLRATSRVNIPDFHTTKFPIVDALTRLGFYSSYSIFFHYSSRLEEEYSSWKIGKK